MKKEKISVKSIIFEISLKKNDSEGCQFSYGESGYIYEFKFNMDNLVIYKDNCFFAELESSSDKAMTFYHWIFNVRHIYVLKFNKINFL